MEARASVSHAIVVLAAVVGLAGCAVSPNGVLGNGQFQYGPDGHGSTDVPGAIAVGASFQLQYMPICQGCDVPVIENGSAFVVTPASPELASVEGRGIVAKRAGFLALLALEPSSAHVDDFVFVRLATVATLTLSAQPTFAFMVGQSLGLFVTAADASGAALAGDLTCAWSVTSGMSLLRISGDPSGEVATVDSLAPGSATVHVMCGAATADLTVTASGSPVSDGGLPDDSSVPHDAGGDSGDSGGVGDSGDAGFDARDAGDGGTNG